MLQPSSQASGGLPTFFKKVKCCMNVNLCTFKVQNCFRNCAGGFLVTRLETSQTAPCKTGFCLKLTEQCIFFLFCELAHRGKGMLGRRPLEGNSTAASLTLQMLHLSSLSSNFLETILIFAGFFFLSLTRTSEPFLYMIYFSLCPDSLRL